MRRAGAGRRRLFFATDVHGSEPTFRKFVNAAKFYGVDVLVLGGDLTGKVLVPIVDLGRGRYRATLHGRVHEVASGEDRAAFQQLLAKLGYYSWVVAEPEYAAFSGDPGAVEETYRRLAAERLAAWVRLAEERLAGTHVRCYVTGGNDDPDDVLEVLQREAGQQVVPCDGRVVPVLDGEYEMLGLGYSNPTPWHTARELEEAEIAARLEGLAAQVRDPARAIFNVHVPPVDSTLDTCPKLDPSTDPPTLVTAGGQPVMIGAGSTAVRQALERWQPLLSLHGHIHESRGMVRIGRTAAVNPGSEYGEGVLRGTIVNLIGDRVESLQMTSG